ncbi:GAF and ANTAR domain-containing protein [Amycolatopsis sp. WGS_07]|uniref:GAF and ANTAR domain-containing protein n=1 Tax=Amycolatopsis sp. WGS_07 TaxID=3076764 RepID=UPI003872D44C
MTALVGLSNGSPGDLTTSDTTDGTGPCSCRALRGGGWWAWVISRVSGPAVTLPSPPRNQTCLLDQCGGLQVVASSDERTRLLELFQLQSDQGPCLEACRTGDVVTVRDLNTVAGRWPAFAAEAIAEGFRSVQAVPLRLRRKVIGALTLFGDNATPLRPENLDIARALADTATVGILQERAIRRGEVVTEQLQHALDSRVTIEQAKDVLAQAGAIPMDEAFDRMRRYVRSHGQRLSTTADRIARKALLPATVLASPYPR